MVSLIICSRHSSIAPELNENIKKTIQTSYELIVIDNSLNKFSIFAAYNKGMELSTGNFFIFLHDDIIFRSQGWGKSILKIFNEHPDIGLIGVAGGTIKTQMPSTWWIGGSVIIRIIQHHKNQIQVKDKNEGFQNNDLMDVAAIDGVFMAMRRDKRIAFDEELKGFHNYDLDLSLKHFLLKKRIVVSQKILLEHFSGGNIDKQWFKSAHQFHKKNFNKLPIVIDEIQSQKLNLVEFGNGANFIRGLLKMDLRTEALYWWLKLFRRKKISKFHWEFTKTLFLNYFSLEKRLRN